jgi:hypothetical protein
MSIAISTALKEWAAICRALQVGKQSILLRKGGIIDTGFQLEATRFLLFPTFFHQQETGVRDEGCEFHDFVNANHPPAGLVRLEAWAEVTGIYQVRELMTAHLIAHLHYWSDEAVEKRFHYRQPGVDVLAVRVYRLPAAIEIDDEASFAGCKSWVPLSRDVDLAGSVPVLTDQQYRDVVSQLDTLLRPTAMA